MTEENSELPPIDLTPESIAAINQWLPQKFTALQRASVELEICVVLGNPVNFSRARGYLLSTLNEITTYLNALGENKNGKDEKHESEEESTSSGVEDQSGSQTEQGEKSGLIV